MRLVRPTFAKLLSRRYTLKSNHETANKSHTYMHIYANLRTNYPIIWHVLPKLQVIKKDLLAMDIISKNIPCCVNSNFCVDGVH